MKKYMSLLLILVISIVIPSYSVEAASGRVQYDSVHNAEVVSWESSVGTSVSVLNLEQLQMGGGVQYKQYYDSVIKVNFAGEEYDAYCLDPSIPRPSGKMKCEPMNANPAAQYIVNRAFTENGFKEGYNHATVLLAFRFLSAMQGTAFGGGDAELSIIKTGIEYYVRLRDYALNNSMDRDAASDEIKLIFENAGLCGTGEGQVNCDSSYPYNLLANKIVQSSATYGDDDQILYTAYSLAYSAKRNGYGQVADDDGQGTLNFEYVENLSNDRNVWYKVTSDVRIDPDLIEFECDACEGNVRHYDFSSSGNSGYLVFDIKEGECEYNIEIYYPIKGGYVCESTADGEYQSLFINIHEEVVGLAQILNGWVNSEDCGEGCCRQNPKISPTYIRGDVNNCCDSTHSYAEQYQLNDLFCKDPDLGDIYYWKKCNSESYMFNEAPINDFCELYCTEKVSVDLPGAITAVSGRYFTLTPNPVGNTTSAYIAGTKRCRVWIDYFEFEDQYTNALNDQARKYNEVQRLRAREKLYESTNPGPTTSGQAVTSNVYAWANGSCEYDCHEVCTPAAEEGGEPDCEEVCSTESHSGSANGSVTYYKWTFGKTRQKYYTIKIDESKHDLGANPNYEKLTLKYNYETNSTHSTYSFYQYNEAISAANAIISDAESNCNSKFTHCSGGCSGDRTDIIGEGVSHTNENVPEAYENLKTDISNAVDAYNASARNGKEIEEALFTCTDFFEPGNPGSNANAMYEFRATQAFSYSQTYLDETGKLVSDIIPIQFKSTPGCRVSGPTIGREGIGFEGEIIEPQYRTDISPDEATKKHEIMIDMGEATLDEMQLQTTTTGFEQFFDEEFEAEKHATVDGKYHAVCEWEEDVNKFYTLVHSGFTQRSSINTANKTIHERQYQIYLTTLEGTYETFWDVSGLGTHTNGRGLFDDYFYTHQDASTCAYEDPRDITMFTCKVKVEHEVVLTGYCNGVVNGTQNCDPFKEGYELVNFKVVEPSDLFPSVNDPAQVPSYNGETYGYNWVVDPEGQAALGAIQQAGREDLTYAPQNMSYSFKLTPQDMAAIKDYNTQQVDNGSGGYSDFTLNCDCPTDPIPAKSTISCSKCKSPFVENLANGKVVYTHGQANVSGWSGRESLGTVRNGNHW